MAQQTSSLFIKQAQIQKQTANGALQRNCDKCRKKKPTLQRSKASSAPEAMLAMPGGQLSSAPARPAGTIEC